MTAPSLADRLALDDLGADRFRSTHPVEGPHVFGGLLLGQALRAACCTVDDRPVRSVHASFLVAGAGGEPLELTVERTRDGSSFCTRRVLVSEPHGPVLVLTADFHRPEDGVDYEVAPTPGVPGPDGLARGRYDNPWVESRDVPVGAVAGAPPHARHAWFRVTGALPDELAWHQQALAYLSDHGPTRAVREPHAHLADDARRQSVTLDHSVWFHRPARLEGWLLSELVPVASGRGRGLATGALRAADGTLLATVAQEVLLRTRPA
ncbi:MAG: acyl-CoA thioesterase [Acidimicrobiales bacterium]